MPTVPLAEQQVRLAPAATQRAVTGATADAFGAVEGRQFEQLGRATQTAGDPLAVAALRLQDRQNDEAVRRAFLDYDQRTRSYLYDPEQGLYNRRGANAQGASTEAFKTLAEYEREVSAGLGNDRQRQTFAERIASVKSGLIDGVTRHEANEFRAVEEETTKAFLDASIKGAAAAHTNPELRAQYRAQGDYELERLGQHHGWTPEMLALKRLEYSTLYHKGIIERMVIDDPTGAREYFKTHQAEIDGGTQTGLEGALKEGATREAAYRETERILGDTNSYSEQLAQARKIEDKVLADEVVRRIKERESERRDMRTEAERQAKDTAWALVTETGKLDAVPPHVMAQLDGYTISAMQNYLDKKGAIDTDFGTYSNLSDLASQDPRKFAKLNMNDYRDKLDDGDWRTVQGWQRSIRAGIAGDEAARKKTVAEATVQQQITTALDAAGIVGTDDATKTRRGAFTRSARSALDQAEAVKGGPLTVDERDKVLGRLLLEGEVLSGSMWANDQEEVRAFEVLGTTDEARFSVTFDDVPETERKDIAEKLTARGRKATEDEIAKLYTQRLLYGR